MADIQAAAAELQAAGYLDWEERMSRALELLGYERRPSSRIEGWTPRGGRWVTVVTSASLEVRELAPGALKMAEDDRMRPRWAPARWVRWLVEDRFVDGLVAAGAVLEQAEPAFQPSQPQVDVQGEVGDGR